MPYIHYIYYYIHTYISLFNSYNMKVGVITNSLNFIEKKMKELQVSDLFNNRWPVSSRGENTS